jgi:hypothetical protein
MRNLFAHALLSNLGGNPLPTDLSTDRVLRDLFWRGGYDRPLGTLTSLAEARAKKPRRPRR